MVYGSTIILLALAASFGVVTSGPVNSGIHAEGHSDLTTRGIKKSDKCPASLDDYEVRCFYQEPTARESGVTASEFFNWLLEFNKSDLSERVKDFEDRAFKFYPVTIEPGDKLCRQFDCIGDHANVKICDYRSKPPNLNYTWSYTEIMIGVRRLGEEFWPEAPLEFKGNPLSEEESVRKWREEPTDTGSCCSSYYNRNRMQQSTDRVWGDIFATSETGLRISIEGIRQPPSNRTTTCDRSKNIVPVRVTFSGQQTRR
ncbi:hypothetical protein TWF102_000650 [Orbilia oligospora]|uniref:Uncharacterized protein n=1 Tax=Orbilia oligospora TaxID=2813651 RepID=A0A7C8MX77_ORBOL|nr:hypothetical protein TWF102_000650 [Orbilia oligospora]KAF3086637.1 hypothetical protein TWF706_011380 [Orbilia oligospora]KAF3099255.1 hypothetical protein TWF103_008770 [Orbilia oligospora]KAF3135251.1 hypothetical protein TWF703_006165 [Orbilia oligospora]